MTKEPKKKPLDMTTEEAMDYLFPKKVAKELKRIVKPEQDSAQTQEDEGDNDSVDSAYEYDKR
ncbi:MAG TPA: hypothetical protein VMM38_00270 [Aridibacter sp.]|nr:hypothetical protein [Aridibacter sp.]